MQKIWKKAMVFTIIALFFGVCVIPNSISEEESSNDIDWWPMYWHDTGHSGYSTAKGPDTNNIKWTWTPEEGMYSFRVVADGKIYLGNGYRGLYCLDANDGSEIWNKSPPGTGEYYAGFEHLAVINGKIYCQVTEFQNDINTLYCLDATDGGEIWDFTINEGTYCMNFPIAESGRVYWGTDKSDLYCLNAETGEIIWVYETNGIASTPAIADGKVYVNRILDFGLVCLDAVTGDEIWREDGYLFIFSVVDGILYGCRSTTITGKAAFCLDADTGDMIWSNDLLDNEGVYGPPAVAYGKVYIGTTKGRLFCFDSIDGEEIWNYTRENEDTFCGGPIVADGKVYCGIYDQGVFCFNAANGNQIWSYEGQGYFFNPGIADGKLFISNSTKLICFEDSEPPNKPTCSYDRNTDEIVVATTDSDGDQVRYGVSWDNTGNVDEWTEYNDSGVEVRIDCEGRKGTVGVIAEDEHGSQSDWTTVKSKNKSINTPFFTFLENHPNLFPLLRQILGL